MEADFDVVQRRINTMLCAEGFAMDAIFSNGSIHCSPMAYGDITSVFGGSGLTGGGEIGDINIAVNFSRGNMQSQWNVHGEFNSVSQRPVPLVPDRIAVGILSLVLAMG